MTCFITKATPTNGIKYSCYTYIRYRSCLTDHTGSISCHIMSLVINSLRSGHIDLHTHARTHAHAHTHLGIKQSLDTPGTVAEHLFQKF